MFNITPEDELQEFLTEYDEYLLGKRKQYSTFVLGKEKGTRIIDMGLKHIFQTFLGWSPREIRDKLTPQFIADLKLEPLINRLPCPPELDRETELQYVAWHLYPQTVNVSRQQLVIKIYTDLMSGKIKKLPKNYFDGSEAYDRARIMFQVMLNEYFQFSCVEDMYEYFSKTNQGRAVINSKRLGIPLKQLFDNLPIDYLHYALPQKLKNDELYWYYKKIKNQVTDEDQQDLVLSEALTEAWQSLLNHIQKSIDAGDEEQ